MCVRVKAVILLVCMILAETVIINMLQQKIEDKVNYDRKEREVSMLMEKQIAKDMICFPIPITERHNISFEDDYGAYRDNGGHEGCDILYDENEPGVIPIVSATDGRITNLGWLYLGGYRVGVTSDQGIYYYYAHFDSCAPGLFVGKEIKAGEFLGFMGNSGEGEEGTKGKFPVHLHFGIYIEDENGNEKSINPYPFLLKNK